MPLTPGTKEVYLGALLGNIIYGFYLSAFVECCVVFVRVKEERTDARQKYIIFTAALMFLLITTRCIINTYRCVAAFNVAEDFVGIGNPDSTLDLIANACWFLLTAFADAFIIFRTYIVWERNWLVIIIPVLLCLANLGSSIWLMTALADLKFSPTVWESIAYKSMNLFLVLTLCTNIICTALISFRILRIYREVSSTSRMYRMRAVSAVVESAAIYTLVLVGALIGNGMNSYVNFVFFYCTPPTIGLVFSYIIIRVSRGTSYGDSETAVSRPTIRFREARPTATQTYELDRNPGAGMRPVSLQLHLESESETQIAVVKHSLDRDMV